MKFSTSTLFSLASFCFSLLARAEEASDVLVLTKDSFQSTIDKNALILVEFYAPWCGHCKALAPEYEKAATELKGSVPLAKVDCTVETDVCNAQGVQGYPTLKIFRNGVASSYEKARKADAIVSYLKKQTLPAVTEVKAKADLEKLVETERVLIVGYFAKEDDAEYKAYKAVANRLRDDFVFAAVVGGDLAKSAEVKVPAVVLHKKFDERKNVFPENVGDKSSTKLTEDTLTKFVQVNSVPLMNDIGPENYSKYIESGQPLAYLFVADKDQRTKIGAFIEPLAKLYRGKLNFVYIDAEQYGGHAANLNLKQEWPAFAIQSTKNNAKYPFKGELTEEAIKKFLEDFVEGKVKPDIKSEPIPETNDGPVKVVVSKQFKEIVQDKSKDVLIEFYAPWCGHCKKLAPIYEEVGAKLAGSPEIVIAKMDATENDLPADVGFTIEGFPTIKLFKAETNEVVDYDGDRTAKGFIEFLRKNAHNKDFTVDETEDQVEEDGKKDDEHDEL